MQGFTRFSPRQSARTRSWGLFLFLVSIAGCSGKCGGGGGDKPDAKAAVNTSTGFGSLTPEQQARALAKVGDHTITLGEFAAVLERMDQFERLRYQSAERRKELLDELINVELLAQEATEKGYDKEPLAQQELRGVLRDAMLADLRKDTPQPNQITEAEVRKFFEDHRAEYKDPERRRVSVLVLRDAATAEKLQKELVPSLTDAKWGELVKADSIDASAKANVPLDLLGDLGIVSPPGDARGDNPRVPEAVRKALFTISGVKGFADKPVAVDGKFYLVHLTQKLDARERSFEEAERVIRVKLAQDKLHEKEEALLATLRKEFPVQIDEAALAAVHVTYPQAGSAEGGTDRDAGASRDAAR